MKKNNHIDDLFREKLEGFSPPPPPHIWQNIQSGIHAGHMHRRRVLTAWLSAAAVALLALIGAWYFSTNTNSTDQLVQQHETNTPGQGTQPSATRPDATILPNTATPETTPAELIAPTARYQLPVETTPAMKVNTDNAAETSAGTWFDFAPLTARKAQLVMNKYNHQLHELTGTTQQAKDLLSAEERLLIAENLRRIENEESEEKAWKMGMFVAPGYSSHTASHTANYNRQMTSPDDEGATNVGGGFSIQYKTGKRWSVESGVYYAQNGQKSSSSTRFLSLSQSNDMAAAPQEHFFSNAVRLENGAMSMNSTAGVIALSNTPKGTEIMGSFDEKTYGNSNALIANGEFSQIFSFLEIPLYARYHILDSQIGIELLGGINAGLVVGNNAYIDNEYGAQRIGRTEDISRVNLSGTIGLGLNYALGKHLSVAIEPRLNYYLNSINTNPDVDFRPYRIGVFTGLSYEF